MCAQAVLSSHPHRSIRSFVRREGRMTPGQARALAKIWPVYGLSPQENTQLNLPQIYGSNQPCILEIGFGHGECLAAMAAQYPDYHFLGVEVFRTGVGALCQQIDAQQRREYRALGSEGPRPATRSERQWKNRGGTPWPGSRPGRKRRRRAKNR